MSNLTCIDIHWDVLGARLARLSNIEQSQFFKAFADEMNNYPTRYERDAQLVFISDGFSDIKPLSTEQKQVYEFISCNK